MKNQSLKYAFLDTIHVSSYICNYIPDIPVLLTDMHRNRGCNWYSTVPLSRNTVNYPSNIFPVSSLARVKHMGPLFPGFGHICVTMYYGRREHGADTGRRCDESHSGERSMI